MKTKLVKDLKEAIKLSGLSDGMTISFHHHLRNGDMVAVMVLDVISELGIRDLNVNISSIFDTHAPFIEYIRDGVITGIETDYMGGVVGRAVSEGILDKPVIFRTHGGRPSDIISGVSPIDVAFIAAPTADPMGNCTGKYGKSACGSLGYAFADAMYAKTSVVITDNLVDYPLTDFSIAEDYIDYVVCVDKIGEPSGIVSGTTNIMLARGIKGSYGLGGITSYMVDMMKSGCFKALLDVQCFDLGAVESIRTNPNHREVSASHYASPSAASSAVDSLDVVILGATEIDTNFNVNVHTDSNGYIMGGSGGHSDTAAGAKMSMIVAPLSRARLPIVVDEVLCKSTPGSTVDVLVTQRGIAVNPLRPELSEKFAAAGLPVVDIRELRDAAEKQRNRHLETRK